MVIDKEVSLRFISVTSARSVVTVVVEFGNMYSFALAIENLWFFISIVHLSATSFVAVTLSVTRAPELPLNTALSRDRQAMRSLPSLNALDETE